MQVSIICPDPYFTAINPLSVTGTTTTDASKPVEVDYNGSVAAGINVELDGTFAANPELVSIQTGAAALSLFSVLASLNSSTYFVMNSVPMQKYVRNVSRTSGVITNLLARVQVGSDWPQLEPGANEVSIYTPDGGQDWELLCFERYGGL
jgi:hypothetical protein